MKKILMIAGGIFFAFFVGLAEFKSDISKKTNPIKHRYNQHCIEGVKYLESKHDGYIAPLIDQQGKPITCEVKI